MQGINKKSMALMIGKFKNKKVLVIGDLMLDEYIWGSVTRISPEAPIPVVEVKKEETKPGGAANVILNLISLGAKVYAAGVVGSDLNAHKLLDYLKKHNVNTEAIAWDKNRPTTVKTRVFAHSQQVVRIDKEYKMDVQAKTIKDVVKSISVFIGKIDAVIFSDYEKGMITKELVSSVVAMAKGKIITVDPKPDNIKIFKGVTLISPNKKEASEAAGISIKNEKDVLAVAKKLKELTDSEAIMITRGEEGLSIYEKGAVLHTIPTEAKEVYDVTGAGDTAISVATLALCAGANFKEAAKLANIAAGRVVAEVGVAVLTPMELKAAVNEASG